MAFENGLVSAKEYLEIDDRSEIRHEYVGGMLYAMTGGIDRHNRIALNIASRLLEIAEGGTCRVYMADMRFQI